MNRSGISPYFLGIAAAVLPLITIHACFIIALLEGHIHGCVPYALDCVSVSHTGRYGSAYFVFKGGMIVTTVLLFMTWHLMRFWLEALGSQRRPSLFWLALIGSLALLIYTLALGHTGDTFYLLRRFGVVLFLLCTFIAQVNCANAVSHIPTLQTSGHKLLRFSAVILAIAIFSLVLDAAMGGTYDRVENAFEWWLILLLNVQQWRLVSLWRKTDFRLQPAANDA